MLENAGFGGGCHWCTEAVFRSLRGVTEVAQGFIAADPPHQAYSEAVSVTWDPDLIGFDDLIAVHLATHASMSQHKMRGKYRSAVYVKDDASAEQARRIIAELAEQTGSAFVTAVLPFRAFKASDKRYQNYYDRNREGPFCAAYIEPKLALLRQRFAGLRREVGHVD